MTAEDAITLIRNGGKAREEGLRALYQDHAQHMLRFFVQRGATPDDSKEVLQDTFVKIVRGAESYSGQGMATSWIWQIARNCLIDYLRKIKNHRDHVIALDQDDWQALAETTAAPPELNPEDSVEACVSAGLIEFSKIMPERVLVLEMQMFGHSIEEIANEIGRTVAATKQYLYESRKKIQPFIAHCTDLLEN